MNQETQPAISELQEEIIKLAFPILLGKHTTVIATWEGSSERYLRIAFGDRVACVYDDGFDIQGPQMDIRLEDADFESWQQAAKLFERHILALE